MWVKVCGTTTLEDALLASEAGADAIGFVFARSPRRVTPTQARAIVAELPRQLEKYGVFVDAGFEEIVETVRECALTGVQLHASPDPRLAERLREHFAEANEPVAIFRVLHYNEDFAAELKALLTEGRADAVLVDSRTAMAVGGTGLSFDWQAARAGFAAAPSGHRLIAAGGLSPENVREAISTLRPWGVDVVSGVEAAPGQKDAARVRAFIAAARAAFAEHST